MVKEKKPSILQQYFSIYDEYQQKYPHQNIVVAMEVGSFFEMRGSDVPQTTSLSAHDSTKLSSTDSDSSGDKIRDLGLLLNCKTYYLDSKKVPETPSRSNPLCLGFPVKEGEKVYFPKMVFEDYWVVVVCQNKSSNNEVTRSVDVVINKATYVPLNDEVQQSQNDPTVLVLYQEMVPYNDNIILGMAALTMATGRIVLYHGSSDLDNKLGVYEDLERWVYSYRPIHILYNDNTELSDQHIPQYGMRGRMQLLSYNVKKEFQNVTYQEQILQDYFGSNNHLNKIDELGLAYCPQTRLALLYLLQYLIDAHCPVQRALQVPVLERHQLRLEKNAIKQLHIDELCEHVICCIGVPGKRLLRERLTSPSTDPKIITNRWDFVDAALTFIENTTRRSEIKILLRNSIKLERILNRMAMSKSLFTGDIRNLFSFIEKLQSLQTTLNSIKDWTPFLQSTHLDPLMNYMKNELFDEESVIKDKPWILNKNLSLVQDDGFLETQQKYRDLYEVAEIMLEKLNIHLGAENILTLKESKTEGYVFIGSRAKVNRSIITLKKTIHPNIPWNETVVSFKSMDGKHALIHSDIAKPLVEIEEQFLKKAKPFYRKLVMYGSVYKNFKDTLRGILNNLAELDVALSCAIYHQKQNHVRPILCCHSSSSAKNNKSDKEEEEEEEEEESQFLAVGLRHAVIEQQLLHGSYIPNDFQLSKKNARKIGIVLYGINSSGKSSAMRSIGLAVVMAQAGLFVPAKEFRLMPFSKIMTRIMGGDDLMKGTSSYTVEILECLQIAKRGDAKTLVLGDEIGQSTDDLSGKSLVSSLMDYMVSKNIKFVIATHMHCLPDLCDNTDFISFQHLHVGKRERSDDDSGNRGCGSLHFDRKLREGTGPSTYGLDVAEDLGMPPQIILPARKKLKRLQNEPESLIRVSHYDSRKVYAPYCSTVGCKNFMEEEDHIIAQVNADDKGFVEQSPGNKIHKHNASNLQGLCKSCHKRKTIKDVANYKNKAKQQKMDQYIKKDN